MMEQTESLHTEKKFFFSDLKTTWLQLQSRLFRFEKKGVEHPRQTPANNYLKTAEEMESDLLYELHFQKSGVIPDASVRLALMKTNKDGYINIQGPGSNPEFMEQNY